MSNEKEVTLEELKKLLAKSNEQEERLVGKFETLLDELIALAREGQAALKRYKPLDWTLIYGPHGTEIKRPGE